MLQDKRNEETHELSKKVNTLSDKLLAESENHEQRVNTFKESIYALENEIKFKQGENDHNKAVHALKIK